MNKIAIKHAWESLHQAQSACEALQRSESFVQTERAWNNFLQAASTVYSKLEKGSKGDPKSEPWFGKVKHERKKDALLSYIHHARNAAEHGITEITEQIPSQFSIGGGDMRIHNLRIDDVGTIRIGRITALNPAQPPKISVTGPYVQLLPVVDDRFNDTFPVPTEHFGLPLESQHPKAIALLALTHLDRIVREASLLAK